MVSLFILSLKIERIKRISILMPEVRCLKFDIRGVVEPFCLLVLLIGV